MAEQVSADCIVIPDSLLDSEMTIGHAMSFTPHVRPEYEYMGVLQGMTMDEVMNCLKWYAHKTPLQYITTLGIPMRLNQIDPHFRLNFLKFLIDQNFHLQFRLHFLGVTRWVHEVLLLAELARSVEHESEGIGIDTSVPVRLGLARKGLRQGDWEERPENYFETTTSTPEAHMNVNAFLEWAQYE
jgi:hypothetical protein